MDGFGDNEEDAEALVDKLRGGDYKDLVKSAQNTQEAQLCLQANGNVVKADPHSAFVKGGAAPPPPAPPAPKEDPEDELRKLRRARLAQLKEEQGWKAQGHGSLRRLADEREFVEIIGPHARGIVLLDDGSYASQEVFKALERLAPRHLEAQFCSLPADRALFLTRMVELDGLPAIFICREGQVTRQLSPSILFQEASASSPLFGSHLARLLLFVDAITPGADGKLESGSEYGSDDEEVPSRRRQVAWQRA
eukprot:TRINITY_DN2043_c0_g1_i1.p1 TRINITY_DN2043_c0_g1~~TRINITY_DN2043_c0_g1_i1.p1  ORF type:complete len:251 (-),score=57.26 TRINITY_DN2043_c0_g1_i1:138-890(-)